MSVRRTQLLGAAAVAAALTLGWSLRDRAAPSPARAAAADEARRPARAAPAHGDAATPAHEGAARDSLRGTRPDGGVRVDARGRPLADLGLRRLFDYFLARLGERDAQAIRADLAAYLRPGLSAAALAQVLAWFDSYVALERAASALAREGGDPRQAVTRLRELRRERMGGEIAEAWWGEEDRYLDYTLAREDLLADPGLGDGERAARAAALDDALPAPRREQQRQDDAAARLLAEGNDYAARGVDPAQRYAERARAYGEPAARRLAELDARQAQWQARLQAFAAQRRAILADPASAPAQREQALAALMASRFDARERLRVDALARNGLLDRY